MMLQKLFGFDPSKHNVKTEMMAGMTSFLTMAYILAVNPNIFSALSVQGMDTRAVFTATVIASVIGTLVMAFYAKMPFGLAPGMGLNAFFVYNVCIQMDYSWQFALTAILLEGILFIILSVTKVRAMIVNAIPTSLKASISVGIGLSIASSGLKNADLIVADKETLMKLGDVTSGTAILCVIGIVIISVLLIYKVKGAMLIGILATTLIGIPMGVTEFKGIIGMPPDVTPLCFQFEWHNIFTLDLYNYTQIVPCFLTLFMMLMTSSISDGILLGIISYVVINALSRKWQKLNFTLIILAIISLIRFIFM